MRRIFYIVLFSVIGFLFVFAVQEWVVRFVNQGAFQYEGGSDEQGEHNLKTLFVGVPLFMALWGWVGAKLARDWRLGVGAIAGILLATLLFFGVPGFKGPCAWIFNFSGNVYGILGWAVASVLFAWSGLLLTNKLLRSRRSTPLVSR